MKSLLSLIILAAVLSAISFAQNEITSTITTTGVGKDQKEAREEALRNAVEQVVGVYVDNQTKVDNFKIISDEILSFSSGFVTNYEILKTENKSGLIYITIKAEVSQTRVLNKLSDMQIKMIEVDGESLSGEAFTIASQSKNAFKLLSQLFKDFPDSAFIIEISEPTLVESGMGSKYGSLKENEVKLQTTFTIKWNLNFYNNMIETFNFINIIPKTFQQKKNKPGSKFTRDGVITTDDFGRIYIISYKDDTIGGDNFPGSSIFIRTGKLPSGHNMQKYFKYPSERSRGTEYYDTPLTIIPSNSWPDYFSDYYAENKILNVHIVFRDENDEAIHEEIIYCRLGQLGLESNFRDESEVYIYSPQYKPEQSNKICDVYGGFESRRFLGGKCVINSKYVLNDIIVTMSTLQKTKSLTVYISRK